MRIERKESAIEKKFAAACKAKGWAVRKLSYPGRAGAPDRIVYARFPVVALAELKRPGERPDPLQEAEHRALDALDHVVQVVRTEEDINRFVSWVLWLEETYATP